MDFRTTEEVAYSEMLDKLLEQEAEWMTRAEKGKTPRIYTGFRSNDIKSRFYPQQIRQMIEKQLSKQARE